MSFDLRRAEPSRAGALTRVIAGLAVVFVVLAILRRHRHGVRCSRSTTTSAMPRTTSATSRPGFVDFLDVVAVIFSNLWCGIALAVGAAYAL